MYFEYICWKFAGRLLDRVNTPPRTFRALLWVEAMLFSTHAINVITSSGLQQPTNLLPTIFFHNSDRGRMTGYQRRRGCGKGAGRLLPQFLAVGKLSKNLLLVEKSPSKNAKIGSINPIWEKIGAKSNFCPSIVSCVENEKICNSLSVFCRKFATSCRADFFNPRRRWWKSLWEQTASETTKLKAVSSRQKINFQVAYFSQLFKPGTNDIMTGQL